MGRVGGNEGAGKELGGEEGKVGVNREDAGFCMKMSDARHPHAAGCNTEGGVLEGLEFVDGGRGGIGKPYRGRVGEQGPNEGFIRN